MATRSELAESINEAHRRLFAAFAGFDDTILETEPVAGIWSARDVAGHLADWHNETVDAVDSALAGKESPRPIREIETYNTTQAALRGIETWEDVAADLRAAWQRVLDSLEQLDDGDLQRIGQLPWGAVEHVEGFFRSVARHALQHVEDAEQWRLRKMGIRERDA